MTDATKKEKVYAVFERISRTYDQGNTYISLGMSGKWKKQFIARIADETEAGGPILDVCTGTGDIAVALARSRPDCMITGLDFSPATLRLARAKGENSPNLRWLQGDAMHLPFKDNAFSAACISFGLRNTTDYLQVLREMARVVKKNGAVYCLDSFVPDITLVKPFYSLYFKYLMPVIGGGLRHRQEYTWLWQSTQDFISINELAALFTQAGLTDIQIKRVLFGACAMHTGKNKT